MGEEDLPSRVMAKQQGKPVAKTSLLRQMDFELTENRIILTNLLSYMM
jgi:hypothetical protein